MISVEFMYDRAWATVGQQTQAGSMRRNDMAGSVEQRDLLEVGKLLQL